ncbi:MAG: hypothetical protein AAF564_17790 [Bacteroidota bacterium]
MITTHILDLHEAAGPFDHISEGDPLVIPLTERRPHPHGYVFRVNEFDLPMEVVKRNRRSMIKYWSAQGKGDECRELLEVEGMTVKSWLIPAGAEIREVPDDE